MIKRIIATVLFLVAGHSVYSQIFNKGFSAGLNVGVTKPFADTHDSDLTFNVGLGIQYHVTPYSFLSADFSKSVLARENLDRNYRSYHNSFSHLALTANISLGQLLASANSRGAFYHHIYLGAGVGVINSDVTKPVSDTTDIYGGKRYKGSDFIIPVNAGMDFKLSKNGRFIGNVNYQFNYSFSDALDGYDTSTSSKSNDMYALTTVGLKYLFGTPPNTPTSTQCYY